MTAALSIRALSQRDLAQVHAWMQASEAPRWSEADLALAAEGRSVRSARERRGWVLVEADGQLAGFLIAAALHLPDVPAECELEYVFVAPGARRSGGGRALVEHLIGWANLLPGGEIWLEVRASNAAARQLYQSCGFTEAGVRADYYRDPPEEAVLMRRRLRQPSIPPYNSL
jgi:ribosomal-protein-alanine N-acetyltransferase